MGISPDVGVIGFRDELVDLVSRLEEEFEMLLKAGIIESRDPSRLSALGAGGAKYDFRLCLSIIATAHSGRFTGVRLAACTKLSSSCMKTLAVVWESRKGTTYVKLPWTWSIFWALDQALCHKVV